MHDLRTQRLHLRPLVSDDAPAIAAALSNWEVSRWLTMVPYPYGLADARAFLTGPSRVADHPHWALDAGRGLIGIVSIKPDLGYWLAASHHGNGLMTEAVAAVLHHHFGQTDDSVLSGHLLGNVPSRRLLVGFGFRDTDVAQVPQKASGAEVSVQRMVLNRADWEAHRA